MERSDFKNVKDKIDLHRALLNAMVLEYIDKESLDIEDRWDMAKDYWEETPDWESEAVDIDIFKRFNTDGNVGFTKYSVCNHNDEVGHNWVFSYMMHMKHQIFKLGEEVSAFEFIWELNKLRIIEEEEGGISFTQKVVVRLNEEELRSTEVKEGDLKQYFTLKKDVIVVTKGDIRKAKEYILKNRLFKFYLR